MTDIKIGQWTQYLRIYRSLRPNAEADPEIPSLQTSAQAVNVSNWVTRDTQYILKVPITQFFLFY